jgi:hypothetical protein
LYAFIVSLIVCVSFAPIGAAAQRGGGGRGQAQPEAQAAESSEPRPFVVIGCLNGPKGLTLNTYKNAQLTISELRPGPVPEVFRIDPSGNQQLFPWTEATLEMTVLRVGDLPPPITKGQTRTLNVKLLKFSVISRSCLTQMRSTTYGNK